MGGGPIFHKPNICGHHFHQDCMDRWKRVCENKQDFHCPICRRVFETLNPNHFNPADEVPVDLTYENWIVETLHVPYEEWINVENKGRVKLTDGTRKSRRNILKDINYFESPETSNEK